MSADTEQKNLDSVDEIELSDMTKALLQTVNAIKPRDLPDEFTKLSVSRAVSLLAIVYEKVRNAIEFREEHLIRRAAIERIIKRRLSLNPSGQDEAENLLRELLWARYFPKNSLGEDDIDAVQHIINNYVKTRVQLIRKDNYGDHEFLDGFLMDLLTCEIEETLSPEISQREAYFTYFIYQTLHKTVRIDGLNEDMKDIYFLVALEKSYRKLERPYQRFHLYSLFYKTFSHQTDKELAENGKKLKQMFEKIDQAIQNPNVAKLNRFVKRQLPTYLILFEIISEQKKGVSEILTSKAKLWEAVEKKCKEKYAQVKSRLTTLAIRSLVYIFITKMLLAVILEYPVSMWLYNEAPLLPIIVNSLFPPLLMIMIVLWFKLPDKDNTERIYERIIQTINADPTFETRVALIAKKKKERNTVLKGFFSILYFGTFVLTLFLIHELLNLLDFHLLSQALFIFFISVVSYFAYRIKQIINEYRLIERDSALSPLIDFFFVPILSLGKFFNKGVAKMNFFTVIFDFFIEAPFKLIIDVIEEWISFTKARKDEII